jgi:hypothetical protein
MNEINPKRLDEICRSFGMMSGPADAEFVQHSGTVADDMIDCDPPYITLPYAWSAFGEDGMNGPPVTDPLMLEITIPAVGDGEDEDAPAWRTPFSDAIAKVIDGALLLDGTLGSRSSPQVQVIINIRDALAALTEKLNKLILEKTTA